MTSSAPPAPPTPPAAPDHGPDHGPEPVAVRTLEVRGDTVVTLDQTRLPFEHVPIVLADAAGCARAIATMQVRGAPLIGAVAAFGLAFAVREAARPAHGKAHGKAHDSDPDRALDVGFDRLAATRPTAVNLRWALERVRRAVRALPPAQRAAGAWREALAISDEDVAINRAIGLHGASLLRALAQRRAGSGRPVTPQAPLQVLTHCNAGRLAAVAHGTALAPVYALHAAGVALHVWVDETRPRNQGASLTAWELADAGVPCTVVADNAGGLLMRTGRVDAAIVGCDRVAGNGDVANKIGTYLKALAARDAGVPFWVACPTPSIDARAADGDAIPIEARDAREVTHVGARAPDARMAEVQVVPDGVAAFNPAFDVTPARLVDALISERGVAPATAAGIAALLAAAPVGA